MGFYPQSITASLLPAQHLDRFHSLLVLHKEHDSLQPQSIPVDPARHLVSCCRPGQHAA